MGKHSRTHSGTGLLAPRVGPLVEELKPPVFDPVTTFCSALPGTCRGYNETEAGLRGISGFDHATLGSSTCELGLRTGEEAFV